MAVQVAVLAGAEVVAIEGSVDRGIHAVRKGGVVVVLGYVVPQMRAAMMRLVYDEVSVMGSRGSTRADLEEAVDLVARGRLRPIIGATYALDHLSAALAGLDDGSVIGRAVVNDF